ncbi:melanopsin-like [Asterias amurensis]|uniref:melanopsin-like n=1 Tax=Asterias amurensis TaxID=7602 RepID=UPI003AB7D22A
MENGDTTTPLSANFTPGTTFDEDLTTDMMDRKSTELEFSFEDHTQRAIVGSVFCLVAAAGLVGNSLVILAVVLSQKLQTRTNAFVVNLATTDLITCFGIIFSAVTLFSKAGLPIPESVCSIAGAVTFLGGACSILTLAAIAINRFVLITKSRETYWSMYTTKKTAAMLVFIWAYALSVCSLPFFGISKWGYSDRYKFCIKDDSAPNSGLYSVLYSALVYPVPLIILIVCYYRIYRHVTNQLKTLKETGIEMDNTSTSCSESIRELHREPVNYSNRQVEITKNLFYVLCAFIVCLAPFAVALAIPASEPAIPWTGMIASFNSAVNPVIYGVKHPHFKEVFRHILRCRYHMIPEPSRFLQAMRSQSN